MTNTPVHAAKGQKTGGLVMRAAGLSPVAPLRSSKGEARLFWAGLAP